MEILAISIQKGGVGKTTTAVTIAQALNHLNKKVLLVDLDPQGNSTYSLSANGKIRGSSYKILNGAEAKCCITQFNNIDVIPAEWALSTVKSAAGSARRLQYALEPIKKEYDYIVIDTPPTAGELQYNALQAATKLIIPLEADIYSLQSLYQITDTAKHINNPNLVIAGIILTKFDKRSKLSRHLQEQIIKAAADLDIPYLGAIRQGIAIKEAAALQTDLYDYAPKSKPALDYMEIAKKL